MCVFQSEIKMKKMSKFVSSAIEDDDKKLTMVTKEENHRGKCMEKEEIEEEEEVEEEEESKEMNIICQLSRHLHQIINRKVNIILIIFF